ncbi:VOC family protein [Tsukamurella sp. 8F]|uniref:VOC family protein n=1 Tax=unclassified Tsukamurella TaxID=2633480 RepID=UPI0023B9F921|nr:MULTISPECIES: VOC family protein [unclassified Tsukamurella]MDF0529059.1 VOC family protein [Tsukamurella sp. 8J]MDF0587432.1 VOC family protein [Tsukamurella sp. 8F]
MADQAAFDHLIHWVDDLGEAMKAYEESGIPTHEALTMPGFRNGAWGVDDERYVELATVDDWEAVRASKYAQGIDILKPAVEALQGPGLLTFAVDVPDARATADRFRAAGREVEVLDVWFEDRGVGFVEVFVRDAPSYFPFFITYEPPRAELGRMRAEHRAAAGISSEGRPDLVALLIGSADPEEDARKLAGFVGCPVRGTVVELPGAEVRFRQEAPLGLFGIDVRGSSIDGSTTIAGVMVNEEQ